MQDNIFTTINYNTVKAIPTIVMWNQTKQDNTIETNHAKQILSLLPKFNWAWQHEGTENWQTFIQYTLEPRHTNQFPNLDK